MSSSSNIIDLNNLPFPDVVETLEFETLLADRKAKFIALWDTEDEQEFWTARLELESEPVVKLLEENAYLELLLREKINNKAKAVMLAFATGSDLDQLGALLGVERLTVTVATDELDAEYESDERFRTRIQMSLEGITTAGSIGSYEYHSLSASALVKDVNVSSPTPGTVLVTILSTEDNGKPTADLISTVNTALNAENVRPLCDTVQVQSAELVNYQINATLTLYPSVIESVVLANAQSSIESYAAKQHRLGLDITLSGIYAALHQEGVQNVKLTAPTTDLIISETQAAVCSAITVTVGGRDE